MEDINIYRSFLPQDTCKIFFEILNNSIPWNDKRLTPTGEIKINRKMAYYSEKGGPYNYAGMELEGHNLSDSPKITGSHGSVNILEYIRKSIELGLHIELNSVLLNLYENGKSEIRWHSDKESQLGEAPIIPCINLGATRKFWFLEKSTGNKFYHEVSSGDLLMMGPNCQKNYLHAILKDKEVTEPRISLTYRYVYGNP